MAMTNANHFLFDRNFRSPGVSDAAHAAALAEAEKQAYRRGLEEGRRQAQGEIQAATAQAARRLADAAQAMLAALDADRAALEEKGVALALALGRKLGGEAMARYPLVAITEVARNAFQHLRGVPHVVVRVHESLVEDVEALTKRIARERGFEGRLVVMGEPDIPPGDARIEWADGGVAREGARIARDVADATDRS